MATIAGLLGPILRLLVAWFTGHNTKEMVARAEAKGEQVDVEEIQTLIHAYHFGPTIEARTAAFEELRRRGAMT